MLERALTAIIIGTILLPAAIAVIGCIIDIIVSTFRGDQL